MIRVAVAAALLLWAVAAPRPAAAYRVQLDAKEASMDKFAQAISPRQLVGSKQVGSAAGKCPPDACRMPLGRRLLPTGHSAIAGDLLALCLWRSFISGNPDATVCKHLHIVTCN